MSLFRPSGSHEPWFQIQDAPPAEPNLEGTAIDGGAFSIELTVRDGKCSADHALTLKAPGDVPLGDLLPSFLDAAEENAEQSGQGFTESDGWTLQLPDGSSPDGATLAELGIHRLALYDALRAPPPFAAATAEGSPGGARETARELGERVAVPPDRDRGPHATGAVGQSSPAAQPSVSRGRVVAAERVVRARCERSLPVRLRTLARVGEAARSLLPSYDLREAQAFGVEDPARFVRENCRSVLRRMQEAWWSTDYERLLEASILMPSLERCQTVACISPKGGVGKTAVSGLLATLFSFVRRGVTLAVDANPDMSNLGMKLAPGQGTLIDDLLGGVLAADEFAPMDVLTRLGQGPDGVYVAPSPNDERRALDERSYRALYEKLARVAEVLVLDCGTGLTSPAMHAALGCADQLVLVSDGDPDTMNLIAGEQCKSLLRSFSGPVFIVANKMSSRARARVSLAQFERELSFAQGIVEVSYERDAAESLPQFSWARQPPDDWAIQLRELAALIAASWDRRP